MCIYNVYQHKLTLSIKFRFSSFLSYNISFILFYFSIETYLEKNLFNDICVIIFPLGERFDNQIMRSAWSSPMIANREFTRKRKEVSSTINTEDELELTMWRSMVSIGGKK